MPRIARQIDAEHSVPTHAPQHALFARAARIVTDAVEPTLHESVARLERQLFACSDSGSPERFAALDALRALGRMRATLLPEYLPRIDAAVRACRAGVGAVPGPDGPWRLVDHADVAEAGLAASLAAALDTALHLPLHLLAERSAVLLQRERLQGHELPFGPRGLLDALRDACARLDMVPDTRAALLRLFARELAQQLPASYDAANAMLAREGVLPELVSYRVRQAAIEHRGRGVAQTSPDATVRSAGQGGAPLTSRSAHWLDLAASDDDASEAAAAGSEQTLFALMRHLLGGRRALSCTPARSAGASASPTRPVTADELQRVLRGLQASAIASPPGSMASRLESVLPLAGAGKTATLDPVQTDTVDLVDLLFDHLVRTVPPRGAVAGLFARLQAPMLRAALDDAAFFTRRQHPARRMLDALAEAGLYWLDADVPAGDPLLAPLQAVVDTVADTYDGDHRVFDDATAAVQKHLAERVRRSAIIERRHVDAERGRERLAFARDRAAAAVRGAIGSVGLPPVLHAFLESAWTDVLALSALRDSDDVFDRRLQAAAELVAFVQARRDSTAWDVMSPDDPGLRSLRDTIESGLLRLGQSADAAAERSMEVIRDAIDAGMHTAAPRNAPAQAETPDVGPLRAARPSDTDAADAGPSPDPSVRQHLEQLRRLPFGTWFDVALDERGSLRCRMSWFSPVTGRCLFVNAHGQRVGDTTLAWLAAELAAGCACIVREPQTSAIDSAWQAILGMLRSLGRQAGTAPA